MRELFPQQQALIGALHLGAMPGTPRSLLSPAEIVEQAVREATILDKAGFDGIILENMHDRPYLKGSVGPEVVATMAVACAEVRRVTTLPIGIQILAGANEQALATAFCAGADFIRAEGFVFAHTADEGLIEACAGPLLRFRQRIGAQRIKILCDIKKKHSSHAITSDLSLVDTAKAAEFFLADGLVVTGLETGSRTDPSEVNDAAAATSLPVWIGSGLTPDNIADYSSAHGLIVGSWMKVDGDWTRPVDPSRAQALVRAVNKASLA
jgi:membrane complex biogenesis BtpA family protein